MDRGTVESLSGTKLEFAFAMAMKYMVIGSREGPFVLQSEDASSFTVFGGGTEWTNYSSFYTDLSNVPLAIAMELGARISMKNGIPTCQIGDTEITGNGYLEALMRAIVFYKTEK